MSKSSCDLFWHIPTSGWELVFKFWDAAFTAHSLQDLGPLLSTSQHPAPSDSEPKLQTAQALLGLKSWIGAVAKQSPVAEYYFIRKLGWSLFFCFPQWIKTAECTFSL